MVGQQARSKAVAAMRMEGHRAEVKWLRHQGWSYAEALGDITRVDWGKVVPQ